MVTVSVAYHRRGWYCQRPPQRLADRHRCEHRRLDRPIRVGQHGTHGDRARLRIDRVADDRHLALESAVAQRRNDHHDGIAYANAVSLLLRHLAHHPDLGQVSDREQLIGRLHHLADRHAPLDDGAGELGRDRDHRADRACVLEPLDGLSTHAEDQQVATRGTQLRFRGKLLVLTALQLGRADHVRIDQQARPFHRALHEFQVKPGLQEVALGRGEFRAVERRERLAHAYVEAERARCIRDPAGHR